VAAVPLTGAAAKIGLHTHIDIRSPLRENNHNTVQNQSKRDGSCPEISLPKLDLVTVEPEASIATTSRLQQLSARINSDSSRAMESAKDREISMAEKMKQVGGRIADTKKKDDDRLKPIYILLERAGEDIQNEAAMMAQIDVRLDNELLDVKGRCADEMEFLVQNRAEAKARLNTQIATACELLSHEFRADKEWARQRANDRWDNTINKVAAVIDNLEAERKNRMRAENRTMDQTIQKMQATALPVEAEKQLRLELEKVLEEAVEEGTLKLQLEMQEEKRQRNENLKTVKKNFREAMGKLAERVDTEMVEREATGEELSEKLSDSIEQLARCISKEATVREESETQMAKLLEEMCSKIKEQIVQEKTDRQSTEKVLMQLLDESIESIALRTNDANVALLKQRRDEREEKRNQREEEAEQRQNEWAQKFEEEKKAAKERYLEEKRQNVIEEEKRLAEQAKLLVAAELQPEEMKMQEEPRDENKQGEATK